MARILIVEDNVLLAQSVGDFLTQQHHRVEIASDGAAALHLITTFEFDAIILDWELPRLEGIEVLKELRSAGGGTPVLMLTARDSIDHKQIGFQSGADDYLTKPFDMRELSMRIDNLLRREARQRTTELKVEALKLDTAKYRVVFNNHPVSLSPREFAILEFLMRHPDVVFSPDALLNRVWGSESEASPESVKVCISRLKSKLCAHGDKPSIENVFGVGYKLTIS